MNLAVSIPSGNLTSSFIEKIRKTFKQEKVIILPERDYKEMLKAKRNAEYLAKLDKSFKQIKEGKKTTFTIEELEAMSK
jgi:hypothetical protein